MSASPSGRNCATNIGAVGLSDVCTETGDTAALMDVAEYDTDAMVSGHVFGEYLDSYSAVPEVDVGSCGVAM